MSSTNNPTETDVTRAIVDVLASIALERMCPQIPLADDPKDLLTIEHIVTAAQQLDVPLEEIFKTVAISIDTDLMHPLLDSARKEIKR